MNKILLGLLSLVLIASTNAFASCPNPSEIYYGFKFFKHLPYWRSNDKAWTTVNENIVYRHLYSPPSSQSIKFEAVSIATGNGKDMPGSASPYVRCIYSIAGGEYIILGPAKLKYHWTYINNQYGTWEYVPLEGDKNFGEWRCTKSANSCSFSG